MTPQRSDALRRHQRAARATDATLEDPFPPGNSRARRIAGCVRSRRDHCRRSIPLPGAGRDFRVCDTGAASALRHFFRGGRTARRLKSAIAAGMVVK